MLKGVFLKESLIEDDRLLQVLKKQFFRPTFERRCP